MLPPLDLWRFGSCAFGSVVCGKGDERRGKWVNAHRDTDVVSAVDCELALVNAPLRRAICIVKI
jgi:hypothetical protein